MRCGRMLASAAFQSDAVTALVFQFLIYVAPGRCAAASGDCLAYRTGRSGARWAGLAISAALVVRAGRPGADDCGESLSGVVLRAPAIESPIEGLIEERGALVIVLRCAGPDFRRAALSRIPLSVVRAVRGAVAGDRAHGDSVRAAAWRSKINGPGSSWCSIGVAGVVFGYVRYKTRFDGSFRADALGYNANGLLAVSFTATLLRGPR